MNQLKSILLLGILTALLVGVGGYLAPNSLPIFLVLALLMNLGAWFFSDKMVLAMNHAQPVPEGQLPQLRRAVEQIAANANIPMPRLYVMPGAQPNAFATGRNPEHGVVCVTEGILRLLDERELKGVLAHEMSHIRNRDVLVASIAAAIASAITYIAHIGLFFGGGSRDREGGGAGALLMAILAPIGATLVQLGISRQREFLADATGAQLCNDPLALASALQKLQQVSQRVPLQTAPATASLFIVNPFGGMKSFLNLFSTHPPLEERIRRLQQMAADLRGVVPQH
ncbi:MAG TPA: zinc metalloprotease HtpX [Planctomycetota bacterium]|nr:zinc metalloprotease HtpX [Planctomycetota bacterium]